MSNFLRMARDVEVAEVPLVSQLVMQFTVTDESRLDYHSVHLTTDTISLIGISVSVNSEMHVFLMYTKI